jgi:hypothetical protein
MEFIGKLATITLLFALGLFAISYKAKQPTTRAYSSNCLVYSNNFSSLEYFNSNSIDEIGAPFTMTFESLSCVKYRCNNYDLNSNKLNLIYSKEQENICNTSHLYFL